MQNLLQLRKATEAFACNCEIVLETPQGIKGTRAVGSPPRRAAHRKWKQPKREKCAAGSEAGRLKPSKPFDTRHGATETLLDFRVALVQYLLTVLLLLFGMVNRFCGTVCWRYITADYRVWCYS